VSLSRRRFLATSGSATLMIGLAVILGVPASALAQQQVSPEALAAAGSLPDRFLGNADAPVTIVEYASMTCPHCAAFHTQTFPQLKSSYIDTGKVRFVLREFPLDSGAAAAAMLARCAVGDDSRVGASGNPSLPPESTTRYYALVDAFFSQQKTWAVAQNLEASLFEVAKQAGFTQESFRACLTNQKLYEAVVGSSESAAKKLEVRSTPTFFVNGKMARGALTFAELSKLIDAELKS
jgi:protein-disulfide isomerase